MKHGIALVLAVTAVLAFVAAPAPAYQNEPTAFRGVAWGAKLDDLEGFKEVEKNGDFTICLRKDENKQFGEAQLDYIEYRFYRGQLFRVDLKYTELWNYDALKERLFHVFGPGEEKKDEHRHWQWVGKDIDIELTYLVFSRTGWVSFIYRPIERQQKEVEKVLGREGSPDF